MLIGAKNRLGVGVVGLEAMSISYELGAQLGVVVELAIKDDGGASRSRANGLFAALQVNDGEPAHADREGAARLFAEGVRPTMFDRGQHCIEKLRVVPGEPSYPAHSVFVSAYEVVAVGMVVTVAPAGTWKSDAGGEAE